MANTISGSVTGLRYAEETSPGVVSGSAVWLQEEPNSYSGGFGAKISTVARNPITDHRQNMKGTVTGIEASGGYEKDLTQNNLVRQMQGFCFADARQKTTTMPLNGTAIDLGAVVGSAHTIAAASGLGSFLPNHLVKTSGFAVASNNGLGKVTTATATLLTLASGLADETDAPAAAKVEAVGYEFASATVDIVIVGGLPRLSRVSGAFDLTTLGLIPGELVYLGADSAGTSFANNQGVARVSAIAATYIEFDKTQWTAIAEVGTAKTVRLFFGTVVKNEATASLIKKKTYQFERTLGDAGIQYLKGAAPNKLSIKVPMKSKVSTTLEFVALDAETATVLKGGTRPVLVSEECFNTSSDFSRIKLSLVDDANAAPTPLFAFADELELSIDNGITAVNAIGVLGAIDTVAGNFTVSGKTSAYLADLAAVDAVRGNANITLDVLLANKNAGLAFDLPLIGLGDGQVNPEKDKAITIPLDTNAYASPKFNHTFLFVHFPYLPSAAEA